MVRIVAAMTVLVALLVMPVSAAEKSDIEWIVARVQQHPQKMTESSIYYVRLKRAVPHSGDLIVLVKDKPNGVHQFGISATYVVTAKEANYRMDTQCDARLSSITGNGIVDNVEWECIAYTSFMEGFVSAQKQRIFDAFVAEAKELLK